MSIIRQILHLLLFPLSSFRHIHFGRSSLLHVIKPEINFLLSPHHISALFEKLDMYNLLSEFSKRIVPCSSLQIYLTKEDSF